MSGLAATETEQIIFISGYHIWPIFCHMTIFSTKTRLCRGSIAVTRIWTCFPRTEQEKSIGEFLRHPKVMPMQLDGFLVYSKHLIVVGRFDEDYVWFPPAAGICLRKWMTNTRFLFEGLIYKQKFARFLFSGPFIDPSLCKRESYSYSGLWSFVY